MKNSNNNKIGKKERIIDIKYKYTKYEVILKNYKTC